MEDSNIRSKSTEGQITSSSESCVPFPIFLQQKNPPTIKNYTFMGEIGRGAFSHVYSALAPDSGEIFSAKVYDYGLLTRMPSDSEESPAIEVQHEIDLMAQLSHRYILSIIDVFFHQETNSLIIITPLAEYGNLQNMIETTDITLDEVLICFFQIAEAMRYLHGEQVVHRDIKPGNILVFGDGYYVLSDFSAAKKLAKQDEMLADTKGTPGFLSPEQCAGNAYLPKPADVWAFGVSLYFAVFKHYPFGLDEVSGHSMVTALMEVTERLNTRELSFPPKADPRVKGLISKCLSKDPAKRPSFDEIVKNPVFERAWGVDRSLVEEEKSCQN